MKKLILFLAFIGFQTASESQSFEWIKSNGINFNFNPSYPNFPISYDHINGRVIDCRLDSFDLIYGSSVLGKYMIESRDTNGIVQWNFTLGSTATVQRMVSDHQGNVIIGGQFQQTLYFGQNDSLNFISLPFLSLNAFLIKLDSQGNLVWKKNVSAAMQGYESIEALAVSPSGEYWVAVTDFFTAQLVGVDVNGNATSFHSIENAKTIGNISFDPFGGMYISGGAGIGPYIMDTDTFNAPYVYNMFLARFNSLQQPAWAYFGNDITFQRPMITTDDVGNVFFSGMKFDSLSFNGTFFHAPIPFGDFFAFKADTMCNVQWVVEQPPLLIGPFGTFTSGSNLFVDADAGGNFYMGGIHQGFVDWGNGYTSTSGAFSERKSAVVKISSSGNTEWVKIGGSQNGNYVHALAVSDEGSCYFTGSFSDTANFDNINIPTTNFYNFMLGKIRKISTAIHEQITTDEILFYPNPANDFIEILNPVRNKKIKIYDLAGREMKFENSLSRKRIDVSNLSQGTYLITIENTGFKAKFIKTNK